MGPQPHVLCHTQTDHLALPDLGILALRVGVLYVPFRLNTELWEALVSCGQLSTHFHHTGVKVSDAAGRPFFAGCSKLSFCHLYFKPRYGFR